MTRILEARNLLVRRKSFVLKGGEFALTAGSTLAVIGPNGAGKSTLIDAIAGVLSYEGSITSSGQELASLKRTERARRIAYVPQRSELRAGLRVREVVAMGRFAHPGQGASQDDKRAMAEAISLLNLSELAQRSFLSLSVGQQQRVLLARAVCTEAPLILLDEPFAPLDIRQRLEAEALLKALQKKRDTAFVIVMHELERASQLCDQVLVLKRGNQVDVGAPNKTLNDELIAEVFGVRRGAYSFELVNTDGRQQHKSEDE